MSRCQVFGCKNEAKYKNPNSNLKYCQLHYDNLEGKIILETKPRIRVVKLIPIGD